MPRLLLVYHFFHPDDVVSARMFSDLAIEQRRRGWDVVALTSNRSCFDPDRTYPAREDWEGGEIHRVFRPPLKQSRPIQRLLNSAWMTSAWLARAPGLGPFDAVVVGSDPAFAPLIGPGLRRLWPRSALAHWCFDLYPEAIAAEGGNGAVRALVPTAARLMNWAYRSYDALVDIGPRMGERLAAYVTGARQATLTPWALVDSVDPPADPETRRQLFGDAKLALLYAGTMGRAHDHRALLAVARACRRRCGNDVTFCFATRGNRHDELLAAVSAEDTNVRFAPFADERSLGQRLRAADLHLISLQPEWAGVVVPSKFFGALAAGRPVLYAGPPESEIARWIAQHDVGVVVGPGAAGVEAATERLLALATGRAELGAWQANARAVYLHDFSKAAINDRWDALLRELVAARGGAPQAAKGTYKSNSPR
ncbi:MAG TPA: glycosyltransferase family 4 protein [Polyangia bacterium]|nr:glycosyltransferase family 4 protein [Polyangia bacterium]